MSQSSDKQPCEKTTKQSDEALVLAGVAVRLVAIVYDGMLILALLFLVGTFLAVVGTLLLMDVGATASEAKQLPAWYRNGVMMPAFVLTLAGFYGLFWRRAGQTLGMQTWRLKVVDRNGRLLSWGQSFVRIFSAAIVPSLCVIMALLLYSSRVAALTGAFLGLICNYVFCWVNRQGLSIHDMLSGTLTLRVPKFHHQGLISGFRKRHLDKTSNSPDEKN